MTEVFYTVNSGLYFEYGTTGIFIDGIHGGAATGFTPVSEKTIQECIDRTGMFRNLKSLLFTHAHEDHYDYSAVHRILQKNSLYCYGPGLSHDPSFSERLSERVLKLNIPPFEIYAVNTVHDGKAPLSREPHISYVINTPEETFFAAGDAVFQENEADLIGSLCRFPVKAAFVNPYQVLLPCNRKFLKKLSPERAVLIHLPLPKDDTYNAKTLYATAVKQYPADMPRLLQPDFFTKCL